MNMKRLTALVLTMIMVLGMTACGAKEEAPAPAPSAPAASEGWTPDRAIELVACYGAGGGHDILLRTMQKIIVNEKLSTANFNVVNMGCGSGIIGITLALELAAVKPDVVMADISESALALTLENAAGLGAKVRTYRSDLFEAWTAKDDNPVVPPADFDLVLANLPYVPDGEAVSAEVTHDPATALYGGADGLDIVRRFLRDALPHLADNCLVMLEVGHDQGHATAAIMQELGYLNCQVLTDMSGKARFPMGYAPAHNPEETPTDE